MTDILSTRTVCCKLGVSSEANTALHATQAAFNAAASYCASVAWERGITDKNTLHHQVYYQTRAEFGLGAQLACCARDKAAEAVRSSRQHANATCPTFRAGSSIRYDARTYRLMEHDQVSLYTTSGRVSAQLVLGDYQQRSLDDRSWTSGGAELIRKRDTWYLCITQSKLAPTPDDPVGVIGVDLGIVQLAITDDGEAYSGEQVARIRSRYHTSRQRLQAVGTKSAKRRLIKQSGTERRFQKDVNHRIAKRLVTKAANECKALALEELTRIRTRTQATVRGRSQRRRHSSWAFEQLREYIRYKALLAGVLVIAVDPRYTSQACNRCGSVDKHNRRSQSLFVCVACGHIAAADQNAACNIRDRAVVNLPLASVHRG